MNRTLASALFVLCLVLGACSPRRETIEHAGSSTARTHGEPPLCDPAHPGIETGSLDAGGTDPGDAKKTASITLASSGDCRRLTLAFLGNEGAPATESGKLTGALDRANGLVRFPLPPSVTEVGQADTVFQDPLVAAVYVVHGLQSQFFVDVHLAHPAMASAHALDGPARLFVDLAPGGGAVPSGAPRAPNVVVIEPRSGAASYPLVVRGYARTFEANVIARIAQGDSIRLTSHATAADWSMTWGEFEMTIASGPSGSVQLFVGEDSAKDGTPTGVTIPLVMQ
jgi:hypothetical protein